MRFKTERLEKEWSILKTKNPKLADLVSSLDRTCIEFFNKDVCITSILRTQKEQDDLYKNVPIDKRPASSPHLYWNACDLRSSDFTHEEIESMLKFLNNCGHDNKYSKTAIYHSIEGNVPHFHIQFKG